MNFLLPCASLRNHFAIMRHGHSKANDAGIVVSSPENGVHGFGLTKFGCQQVMDSLKQENQLNSETIIISSDFRRTKETAKIMHAELGCIQAIRFDIRLRERFFGEFELTENTIYDQVWLKDAADPNHSDHQVESANSVMKRATEFLLDMDQQYAKCMILLISHGDTLQILQTAFAGQTANLHRRMQHLETAEVRHLQLEN